MRLSLYASLAGVFGVGFHELLYRRFTPPLNTDFELGGLITHAGIDMILLWLLLLTIVVVHDLNQHRRL